MDCGEEQHSDEGEDSEEEASQDSSDYIAFLVCRHDPAEYWLKDEPQDKEKFLRVAPELNGPFMRSVSFPQRYRPHLHTEEVLTMLTFTFKMTLAIFFLLCLSGCVPFDGPRPKGDHALPTMEPMGSREAASAPPVAVGETGACTDPSLSNPDVDCTAWSYLHSLMVITSGMDDELTNSTDIELDTDRLEKEIYPLFVQAQLNCGQWVEPLNDYEPISDVLAMLAFWGLESYDYNPSSLIEFLLRGAAQEEFASSAEEIGCVKSLFVLFVSYEEKD